MLRLRFSPLFLFAIILALAMFLSCSSGGDNTDGSSEGSCGAVSDDGWPFDPSGEELEPSPSLDSLKIIYDVDFDGIHHLGDNIIEIKYKDGSDPEIINDYESERVVVASDGEDVTVTMPISNKIYSFILSGTTRNGSLTFTGDVRKELYLNGVSITSSKGPAIKQLGSKHVLVHLVKGTNNYLADGPNYKCSNFAENEPNAKGAFFSEGKLEFEGSGSLEVKGKCNHAIAVDEDFEINNGRVTISEAVGDGIHANDRIKVKGGVLDIKSVGDAIQSEKAPKDDDKNPLDWMRIVGGKIKAQTTGTKSHGITAEGPIRIDSAAVVQISVKGNGSKGIKSSGTVEEKNQSGEVVTKHPPRQLDFFGGKVFIKASGSRDIDNTATPPDTSAAAGIKLDGILSITGGELTVKSPGCKAKGINITNGTISGGNTRVEADDDGIKVNAEGRLQITGGTVYIKSAKKKAIDGTYTDSGNNTTLIDGGF